MTNRPVRAGLNIYSNIISNFDLQFKLYFKVIEYKKVKTKIAPSGRILSSAYWSKCEPFLIDTI